MIRLPRFMIRGQAQQVIVRGNNRQALWRQEGAGYEEEGASGQCLFVIVWHFILAYKAEVGRRFT